MAKEPLNVMLYRRDVFKIYWQRDDIFHETKNLIFILDSENWNELHSAPLKKE